MLVGLESVILFETFACLVLWRSGRDGYVLQSVVAHVLLLLFLSCVQVRIFLLLSVTPMRAIS
jgi:hypothetical protein